MVKYGIVLIRFVEEKVTLHVVMVKYIILILKSVSVLLVKYGRTINANVKQIRYLRIINVFVIKLEYGMKIFKSVIVKIENSLLMINAHVLVILLLIQILINVIVLMVENGMF